MKNLHPAQAYPNDRYKMGQHVPLTIGYYYGTIPRLLSDLAITAWIIIAISICLGLLLLHTLRVFLKRCAADGGQGAAHLYDYNQTLFEFWISYCRLVFLLFVVTVIACLIFLRAIRTEAGLSVLSAVSGFAIAVGVRSGDNPGPLGTSIGPQSPSPSKALVHSDKPEGPTSPGLVAERTIGGLGSNLAEQADHLATQSEGKSKMAGTPTCRYDVDKLDQWGRLIKSWATHLDYVSQAEALQPPRDYWVNKTWPSEVGRTPAAVTIPDTDANGEPKLWCLPKGGAVIVPHANGGTVTLPFATAMTVDDFTKRVTAAGVVITHMPPQYTHVIIVQGSYQTMVMRLPPKDTLQSSEDDLLNGTPYTMHPFYCSLFGGPPHMPQDAAGIMELHANRIGEYTLNNCT